MTQEVAQNPAMVYFQLIQQGVPPSKAFMQAYPNGLPKKPTPEDLAKEQQKAGLGQIAGGLAGTLGTYYLIDALTGSGTAATAGLGAGATGAAGSAGASLGGTAIGGTTAGGMPAATLAAPQLTPVLPGAAGATGGAAAIGSAGAAAPTGLLTGASPALYFGAPLAFLGASAALAPSAVKAGRKIALALGIGDKRPEREYNPAIQAQSKNINLQLPGLSQMDPTQSKAILDKFYEAGAIRMPGRLGEDEAALEASTEGSSMIMPRMLMQDRQKLQEKHGKWNRALPIGEMIDIMKKSPTYKQGHPGNQALYDAYGMYQNAMNRQPLGVAQQGSGSGAYVEPRGPTGMKPMASGALGSAIQGGGQATGYMPDRGQSLLQALQGNLPVNNKPLSVTNGKGGGMYSSGMFTQDDLYKAMEMMRRKQGGGQ